MMTTTSKYMMAAALLLTIAPVQAAFSQSVYERWQLKRLFEPAKSQLKLEQKGRVFVYEGLQDKVINRVMEDQFERVETMMFVGTVVTDEKGRVKKDPSTGLVLTEDDGC